MMTIRRSTDVNRQIRIVAPVVVVGGTYQIDDGTEVMAPGTVISTILVTDSSAISIVEGRGGDRLRIRKMMGVKVLSQGVVA
jgi:hypothetical protein